MKDQESTLPTNQSTLNSQNIANRRDDKPKSVFIKSNVRHVRLTIHSPATEWGSSIWRLQIWGYEVPDITVHHLI